MSVSTIDQVGRLLRGRELQFRAVVITALCSYFLQLMAIWLHWALWAIALATILPWIPLFTMKVLWTSKHYGFMALYLVIMVLQAGHVMEHVVQMLQFILIYNPAVGCFGWSWYGGCSQAHGVFGELDRELVHFVWDGLILVAVVVVRIHFRHEKNIWMNIAIAAAAIHQVEHIYLFGNYELNNYFYNHGGYFLGVHIVNGLAAQNGLMGHNGFVGSLIPAINFLLPGRINLHFIYNTFVFIPMVLAFRQQVRYIYDEWLAKALPHLSEEQLVAATAQAETVKFAAGQVVFRQGDPADKFYIITKGRVEVLRRDARANQEMQVAQLSEGQYFGEIGVLGRTERTATIKAVTDLECLALSGAVLKELLVSSSAAYKDVDVVLRNRLAQLGAFHGLPVSDSVKADQDTILKTRMIRDRLQLLQGDDISRMLGRSPAHAQYAQPRPVPVQAQAGPGVAVMDRPGVGPYAAPAPGPQPVGPFPPRTPAPGPVVPGSFPVGGGPGSAPSPALGPVGPGSVPVGVAGSGPIVPVNQGFYRGSLLVRSGPATGLRFQINTPRLIIGRRGVSAPANEDAPMMLIDDARISRNHLEIFAQPDGLYARDLGSANGSWLNGRPLGGEPARLEDGAELLLGPDSMLNYRLN